MHLCKVQTCNKYIIGIPMHFWAKIWFITGIIAFIISMICEIVGVKLTMLDPSIPKVASILPIWDANCMVEIIDMVLYHVLGTSN